MSAGTGLGGLEAGPAAGEGPVRFPCPRSGQLGPRSADPQREAVVGGVPERRRAERRLKPAAAELLPYREVPGLITAVSGDPALPFWWCFCSVLPSNPQEHGETSRPRAAGPG